MMFLPVVPATGHHSSPPESVCVRGVSRGVYTHSTRFPLRAITLGENAIARSPRSTDTAAGWGSDRAVVALRSLVPAYRELVSALGRFGDRRLPYPAPTTAGTPLSTGRTRYPPTGDYSLWRRRGSVLKMPSHRGDDTPKP